jgi:hypothetical protein
VQTLLLDTRAWDLCLDAKGNIAVASEPYAQAQDVASAIRLFLAECYYDTTRGVRYFQDILGKTPPLPLLKAELTYAAQTVPGVTDARAFIQVTPDRVVTGQVQCTSAAGGFAVTGAISTGGTGPFIGTGPFVIQSTGIGQGAIG